MGEMVLFHILPFDQPLVWGEYNPGQKIVEKFTKLSKIGLSMECFIAECFIFRNFLEQVLKFDSWVTGWVVAIKSKYFTDFPEIL